MSRLNLENNTYYHIYNRGVDKRKIFLDKWDYVRFLESMREFNSVESCGGLYRKFLLNKYSTSGDPISNLEIGSQNRSLVKILSYCLLPNHYHFLIMQSKDRGVSEFMKKLGIGYTAYFNKKYNRSGSLFQGKYKILEAEEYSHFLKLAVYVNCNAEVHSIAKSKNWIWSSYLDYIGERDGNLCDKEDILKEFNSNLDFKNFCREVLPSIIGIKGMKD